MPQKTDRKTILRRALVQLLVALVVILLDRLLKIWIVNHISGEIVGGSWVRTGENVPLIPGVIHLTQVHNFGAAFSILENMRWPLLIASLVLMGVVVWALFSGKARHPAARWSLGLVLGGALGNAIDRAAMGYVVDMFEVEFMHYAVFNLADVFIVCGAILFCIYILFFEGKQPARKESFPVVSWEEYASQKQEKDSEKQNHEDSN